jgi:leucyl-tRNA synthetase
MNSIDFHSIEKKWQDRWEEAKIFESDPGDGEKQFITFPYPYVNGNAHIGHSYSSLRTDAFARFKRLQGFNVLYPQGFHATGEPIVGTVERILKGDQGQIDTLKQFGATNEDIEKFKTSPEFVARFWIKKWKDVLRKAGFGIDWRRSFVTTTMNPTYSRFIEWQYNTLKKNGYVVQGTHPVIWCPKDQSPTGDHDRLVGEGESIKDFVWIKFKLKDSDLILMTGTTRPDALLGQANMWINPNTTYKIVEVGGEKWIVGEPAIQKIEDQHKKPKVVGDIKGTELIGKWVRGPIADYDLYILPADFIDASVGSGIVYSALEDPVDLMELRKLQKSPDIIKKYNLDPAVVAKLKPISIISIPDMGNDLGDHVIKEFKVKSETDEKNLKKAKDELNKRAFRSGVMKKNCKQYTGMTVPEAQEAIKKDLLLVKDIVMFYEMTGEVVCRCTTPCTVKILENQWFLKFSDEEWKKKVRKALKGMKIYPDKARANFEYTIEWLKDKACARKGGLGTPVPWDNEWIVETLSDSTIYMAYYTIARIINEKKIDASVLTDDVFDYIFLDKGKVDAAKGGLNKETIEEMKAEFEYYYPVDFRNSGKDLVQNHLTFFLFHHTAIWPEKMWPKAISVNGFVNVEGEKMSKSKGNIIPLTDMLDKYGADIVRLNMITASEGIDDADWRSENVKGLIPRLELLYDLAVGIEKAKGEKKSIDAYLENKIKKEVSKSIANYEKVKLRTAGTHVLYNITNTFRWYLKRVGDIENAHKETLNAALERSIKALTPMAPHFCEEVWEVLGKKEFVATQKLEVEDYDDSTEASEELVRTVAEDIEEIKKFVSGKRKVIVFVAEKWKFEAYDKISQEEDPKTVISEMAAQYPEKGKDIASFILSLKKGTVDVMNRKDQTKTLEEAIDFLKNQTGMIVEIQSAENNDEKKAKSASPDKPGLLFE